MIRALSIFLLFAALFTSCTNDQSVKSNKSSLQGTSNTSSGSTQSSSSNLRVIEKVTQGSTQQNQVKLSIQLYSPTGSMPVFSSSSTIQCRFEWMENLSNGESIPRSQKVSYTVESQNSNLGTCAFPQAEYELIDYSKIDIRLETPSGSLLSETYAFWKNQAQQNVSANWYTSDDIPMMNIERTVVVEEIKKGVEIQNLSQTVYGGKKLLSATHFCFVTESNANGPGNCALNTNTTLQKEYTLQVNYYSIYYPYLWRRSNAEAGSTTGRKALVLKSSNQLFPRNPSVGDTNTTYEDYFPRDRTFSLARYPAGVFTLPVQARRDLLSVQTSYQFDNGSNTPGNLPQPDRTIGYAALPNSDGTCPSVKRKITNSNTTELLQTPTFRLRKFVLEYPIRHDADGTPLQNEPAKDIVYVLDRPVINGSNLATMLGPKPCPLAYFDGKNVAHPNTKYYYPTHSESLKNVSLDGVYLPNEDKVSNGNMTSCAATISVSNEESSLVSMATIHSLNKNWSDGTDYSKMPVKPMEPFFMEYKEDTSFQACAPTPPQDQFVDAPLYTQKFDDSLHAYCAKIYPNKNPGTDIFASGAQRSTILSGEESVVRERNYSTSRLSQIMIPLVQNSNDLGVAIQPMQSSNAELENSSYACAITYDGKNTSQGSKVRLKTPSEGCAQGMSGVGAISNRHLEPFPVPFQAVPNWKAPVY